jgi:hypothetical protein
VLGLAEELTLDEAVGDAVAEALADGLWLTDDDGVADTEAETVALADADGLRDTDAERLDDGDVDALGLGLTEALTLLDGLCDADGLGETEAEMLEDGDGLLLVDEDTDGETLDEGEADTLDEGDGLTEAETLGLTDADGPKAPNRSSVDAATNEWSTFRWIAGIWIGTICAPPRVFATALGEAEALTELDAVALGDDEIEDDAVALGDAEIEGLTDADALLIISRTAKCTMARSSDVPDVMPTEREPWPAVVSTAPTKHCPPTSIVFSAVELAPLVGGVWCPKCPKA